MVAVFTASLSSGSLAAASSFDGDDFVGKEQADQDALLAVQLWQEWFLSELELPPGVLRHEPRFTTCGTKLKLATHPKVHEVRPVP